MIQTKLSGAISDIKLVASQTSLLEESEMDHKSSNHIRLLYTWTKKSSHVTQLDSSSKIF